MNKKFSTLVATLLVAGAGMTLNAEVIKVTAPKVGGSYLIGLAATDGVGANGKVGGLLQITSAGTGLEATADAEAAYQAVGGEWTLVDAKLTGKKAFYLVKDGKYICAAAPSSDKTLKVSAEDADKASRIKFEINTDGKIVVAEVIGANIVVGDELKIASEVVSLEATTGGVAVVFATYQADKEVTVGTGASETKQPLVSSLDKDTYYFIAANDGKLLSFASKTATTVTAGAGTGITSANVADYLWKAVETTTGGKTQYAFENKAYPGKYANIGSTTAFAANGKYSKGVALYVGANSVDVDFTAGGTADAAIAFGLYEAIQLPYTVGELKQDLGDGFNLSIAVKKDDKSAIQGADVFKGVLTPVGTTTADDKDDVYFQLKNGDKYIVLNTKNIWAGNVGNEDLQRGAKFELVEEADLTNTDYLSFFRISHTSGNDASKDILVEVLEGDNTTAYGRLFVVSAGTENFLTTSLDKADNETWAYVQRAAGNIVDVKTLLGKFWNITYADTKENAKKNGEEYKVNGVVVTKRVGITELGDYVDAGTVLLSSPETQWAVTNVYEDGTFVIRNRESQCNIAGIQLRTTETPNVFVVSQANDESIKGDLIRLTEVKNHGKYDGFMRTDANTLRNQVFNIGQYHNETGNAVAYWTENHGGSHKLGVSTEDPANWKLHLAMKADEAKKNEVDTVLIITKMAALQPDGSIKKEATPDTLAVLPYLVQNNSNLEYVLYKENGLNYYACNEVADTKVGAQRFALKMKPNGTYNVFAASVGFLGYSKVYAANSADKGYLDNMSRYERDNNSLMVIEEIAKPEYRKVKKEWGDVVKIYREEYPTEVLFEKRDAKSVVDGDTLSFLNVNNSVNGANPALFVDTAYVNRTVDGVANTCYQYLLGVNVDKDDTYYCPYNPEHNTQAWRDEHNGGKPCADAMEHQAVKGRFLINLVDTAFAYKQDHLHNNPYINMVEADEDLAKLSFVEGVHANDTLYITRKGGEVVKLAMDTAAFNVAKFAFRYVDNAAGSFKIQTQSKSYSKSADQTLKEFNESAHNEGYLRWVNGTVVVTNSYTNGEVFNMEENYNGQAVSNEDITASSISVVAGEGQVTIKGAAGKTVVISNVLGQTIASTVLSSDKAEISAPAGVVVVAVEGEAAVKAIVK